MGSEAVARPALAGLSVALVLPLTYHLIVDPVLLEPATGAHDRALIGYTVMWLLAATVVVSTVFIEKRPLASIGVCRPSPRQVMLAVGLGVLLSLAVPLLSLAAQAVVSASDGSVFDVAGGVSAAVLAVGVVTAAVTEEVLFRGYAIERLLEATGRRWLSGGLSLAVFTAIHVPNWGLAHSIGIVLPLGAALTVLYLWKRNLPVVIVAHLLIDAPLIVLALAA